MHKGILRFQLAETDYFRILLRDLLYVVEHAVNDMTKVVLVSIERCFRKLATRLISVALTRLSYLAFYVSAVASTSTIDADRQVSDFSFHRVAVTDVSRFQVTERKAISQISSVDSIVDTTNSSVADASTIYSSKLRPSFRYEAGAQAPQLLARGGSQENRIVNANCFFCYPKGCDYVETYYLQCTKAERWPT